MGKGTVVRHRGDGQYRVRLNRSTARIETALARVTTDLSTLQERIDTAWQKLQGAQTRLSAAIGEKNAAIAAISDRIQDLADAVREARERVDQRTDELRTAQESLDYLEQAKKDDPESVTDEQIRIATEQRDAKQALLDAANDHLTSATDAWNSRDVDAKEQDAKLVAAAKLREELSTSRLIYNGLLLAKASLEKRKAWLESKRKDDPELDAWCADLTEDLGGEVGTIEIPGERNAESDPLLIRPGYEGRATYQPRDPHQALIDAKTAAFTGSIQAQDRLDAAQSGARYRRQQTPRTAGPARQPAVSARTRSSRDRFPTGPDRRLRHIDPGPRGMESGLRRRAPKASAALEWSDPQLATRPGRSLETRSNQ